MKQILFTGITPTGTLTLGHYCGVINYLLTAQHEYDIVIMIADLHALTIPKKNFDYKTTSLNIAALLYACGLKKENCKIFIQSQVSEHSELFFLLSPFITVEKLKNMIQYKEKAKNQNLLSLLSYPVLMTADILLYCPKLVITGDDQKQHLELATKIIEKINNFTKTIFEKPTFITSPQGSKILCLKNPKKKCQKVLTIV